MDTTIAYCFLPVDDHEKALGFYRDVLGFEVRKDVGYQDMRWITMGIPAQPGIELVLEPPCADASPEDRETMKTFMAKGLLGRLVFATDNCDKLFEHIQLAGADVVQEPIDQPYGVRDCAFRDPAGNLLRFQTLT